MFSSADPNPSVGISTHSLGPGLSPHSFQALEE
jgi:hypothetical protein